MPTLPTAQDVRKARKQATDTVTNVARTPLLAVLGAGDAAAHAISNAMRRTRDDTTERVEENQERLRAALADLQARLSELPQELRELRAHLEPAEVRKLADSYAQIAQQVYVSLADRGEQAFGRIKTRPQVRRAIDSAEAGVDAAQLQVEQIVENFSRLADEILGRFATGARSTGEKTARRTQQASEQAATQVQQVAGDAAEELREAGDRTASTTRSTSRKTANRAEAQRRPATRRGSTTKRGS
jgi:heparin binding hemagglutinin HbhA